MTFGYVTLAGGTVRGKAATPYAPCNWRRYAVLSFAAVAITSAMVDPCSLMNRAASLPSIAETLKLMFWFTIVPPPEARAA